MGTVLEKIFMKLCASVMLHLKYYVVTVSSDDFVVTEKYSLPCGIMGILFIMFAELWVTIFNRFAELWVTVFQTWTSFQVWV